MQTRHDSVFPWGTLTVNVLGSFLLGVLTGATDALAPAFAAALGVGFCGALTSYSTFSYETLRLVETKAGFYAVANVAMDLLAGFGAAGRRRRRVRPAGGAPAQLWGGLSAP